MSRGEVLAWLLEPDQPSIRYLTLTQRLGKKETDPEVREAKARFRKPGGSPIRSPAATRAAWWAQESWIELRIGGAFEVYFLLDQPRGAQGAEGFRILSYRPLEMLSFSWNFPPEIPEIRSAQT